MKSLNETNDLWINKEDEKCEAYQTCFLSCCYNSCCHNTCCDDCCAVTSW